MSPEFEKEVVRVVEEAVLRGVVEGRRLERAAIVADLRRVANDDLDEVTERKLRWQADRYERGEHEEAT